MNDHHPTKVLAIMGSPRKKGDTFRATKAVEEKLVSLGDVEVEYVFLTEADLEMCRGCFACTLRGAARCPIDDDRAELEEKMLAAHGVIFASPAYVQNVSALMKNLMDRFNYACHRPRFFDQKALILSTGGGPWAVKACLEVLEGFAFGCGFDQVAKVGALGRPLSKHQRPEVKQKAEDELDQAATTFFEAMQGGRRARPTRKHLMFFRAMRASICFSPEVFPRDQTYWKEQGWLERDALFFYPAEVNPFANALAWLFERVVARSLKKDMVIG